MNEQKLQQIEARCNAATANSELTLARFDHGGGRLRAGDNELIADFYDRENREFYYSARTDMPALIAALREAWAKIDELGRCG